jgi:hypothetical protein
LYIEPEDYPSEVVLCDPSHIGVEDLKTLWMCWHEMDSDGRGLRFSGAGSKRSRRQKGKGKKRVKSYVEVSDSAPVQVPDSAPAPPSPPPTNDLVTVATDLTVVVAHSSSPAAIAHTLDSRTDYLRSLCTEKTYLDAVTWIHFMVSLSSNLTSFLLMALIASK